MCTQATGHDTETAKIAPLSLQNHSNLGKIGDISSWLQYQNSSGAHWFFSAISVRVQLQSFIWNVCFITVIHFQIVALQDITIATFKIRQNVTIGNQSPKKQRCFITALYGLKRLLNKRGRRNILCPLTFFTSCTSYCYIAVCKDSQFAAKAQQE